MKQLARIVFLIGCGLAAAAFVFAEAWPATHVDDLAGKPRVVILSDIGNEPDDQMSFVRLLLYSNELDLEAMIATTSTWQKKATHPETMRQLIDAYGQVRSNLLQNAQGWPEAGDLAARVFVGQTAYGLAATGPGKTSPGSEGIVRAADRDDARPLWICIWGGASTLAQALMDARATRTPEQLARLVAKAARVFDLATRTMRARGFAANFRTFSTSCRHRRRPAASTTTRRGRGSVATATTATARARILRR